MQRALRPRPAFFKPSRTVSALRDDTTLHISAAMRDAMLSIRDRLDSLGIAISGLCAVHCVLSIVLVSLLGLGGEVLLNPAIHRIGLALAVLVGMVTLGIGVMRHGRMSVLVIGFVGIALMAAGLFVHHGAPEAALTVTGVALVALAHIRNLRHSA